MSNERKKEETRPTSDSSGSKNTKFLWLALSLISLVLIFLFVGVPNLSYTTEFINYFGFSPRYLSAEEKEFVKPAVAKELTKLKNEVAKIMLERKRLINSSGSLKLDDMEDSLSGLRAYDEELNLARASFASACKSAKHFNII